MKRKECTLLHVMMGGQSVGDLQACDIHGNGRSNKAWLGKIDGEEVEFPNLKAVAAWAKKQGYEVDRAFEP